MKIRAARIEDMPAVTAIHNDAVVNTTAIWTESTADVADREQWLDERTQSGFPVFVAVDEIQDVVGFASYGPWRAKEGYRLTVEHSVYVRSDQQGKGVGKELMIALIQEAKTAGLHAMVAGVEAQNVGSIKLHEKLGFEQVGLLKQVGQKFGRWLDLAFLQLTLDQRESPDAS
ncbi:N-acetyltransferase [Glutamicibacter uratoxydans]|uniref:N-acetyltransferase n=1 Tax=Glutamicibacter uratoxydans TaxID=43667 RepID=A0A4Y4DKE7_GLUUR|nr:GNAT family N-acetyltransferase [Glutamicibacter uratoxydans]GED05097.1 N-acetyltransferase [Glutamicibacter uratoxydans]